MRLTRLDIANFRRLSTVSFEPHARFNLFTGPNGAGKSSVLEAIHCLSTGHSFRSRRSRELVTHGHDGFTVSARLFDDDVEREHRIGLARRRDGELDLRVDFESVSSVATATRLLPVKALTPDSHALLQEGPDERRRFLDWGVFHVEPRFLDTWRQFRRVLSQRNQALRDLRPDAEVTSWDEQLARSGLEIDGFRRRYVDALGAGLQARVARLTEPLDIRLRYRSGWKVEVGSLADVLADNLAHHRRMRTTTDGPHRGELVVTSGDVPARQELSRGQQKSLIYLMHFAQLDLLESAAGHRPVILCDDLLSELDGHNGAGIVEQLLELSAQVFVTGVSGGLLNDHPGQRFHVEQGRILSTVNQGIDGIETNVG